MSDDPSLSFERFDVLIPFDKSWGNKRWINAWHAARSLRSIISILKLTAATILNNVVLIHIIMLSILINGSLILVFLAHQHLLAFFFHFTKLWCAYNSLVSEHPLIQVQSRSPTFPGIWKYFCAIRGHLPLALWLCSIITYKLQTSIQFSWGTISPNLILVGVWCTLKLFIWIIWLIFCLVVIGKEANQYVIVHHVAC